MGTIFSLSGSKAVGKTTLIQGLRKKIPDLIIREGFRQVNNEYNMNIEKDYYDNERWYISREIEEFQKMKQLPNPVLLLRGPEDLAFYAIHYPKISNFNWDVEKNLFHELTELRECKSDYILYLDADIETILKRKNEDLTKSRKNMDNWLKYWQPYIERYIKSIEYTTVLNTNDMPTNEVLKWTLEWINKKMKERY